MLLRDHLSEANKNKRQREQNQMKSLRMLIVGYNQLSSLPDSIGQLENLVDLEANHNKLNSLPRFENKMLRSVLNAKPPFFFFFFLAAQINFF